VEQDARKLAAVTPKFYIEDDGTDYPDGEEFNGLWCGGTLADPTGYADIAHWKLNERLGNIAYNNRVRAYNPLKISSMAWTADAVGDYLQYKLVDFEPLNAPRHDFYCMMGSSGYNASTNWINFLRGPGFDNAFPMTGAFEGKLIFDIWIYCRKPPQASGDRQALLHLVNLPGGTATSGFDKGCALWFGIVNESGNPQLRFYWTQDVSTVTPFTPPAGWNGLAEIRSRAAGKVLFPANNLTDDGGLHHVAFVFDSTKRQISGDPDPGEIRFSTFDNGGANSDVLKLAPEGFYVDGQWYEADHTSTDSGWSVTSQHNGECRIETNPFIGCELIDTGAWDPTQINGNPAFRNHFTGKIYQVQMHTWPTNADYPSTDSAMSRDRMRVLFNLKFDIPRGPQPVDFSDKNEFKGINSLQSVGALKQVIETGKGTFYVTFNSVKVKN
jgi:hypothetical protein